MLSAFVQQLSPKRTLMISGLKKKISGEFITRLKYYAFKPSVIVCEFTGSGILIEGVVFIT